MARPALKSRIVSALRKIWLHSEMRQEALRASRIERGVYRCGLCGKKMPATLKTANGTIRKVAVDHKTRVVPETGWDSWDGFIERLFCEQSKLQVLCFECHHEKSTRERKESCKNPVSSKCGRKKTKTLAVKNSDARKRSTPTSKKYTKCNQQSGPSTKPSRSKAKREAPSGSSDATLCQGTQSK